jgi:glycosyltransferase involved in cell wall biosynthesis
VAERNWREELGIPADALFLILQGAFLDQDRGVVQAVEALRTQSDWYLVVVGAGAEWDWANQQVEGMGGRLICLPKMPFETLRSLTAAADVGLSLDRGIHGNYWMSLPNKLFDYIHAGIPVVASPMPEVVRIVQNHGIGVIAEELDARGIATAIRELRQHDFAAWRVRCLAAAKTLNWEAEENQISLALSKAAAV